MADQRWSTMSDQSWLAHSGSAPRRILPQLISDGLTPARQRRHFGLGGIGLYRFASDRQPKPVWLAPRLHRMRSKPVMFVPDFPPNCWRLFCLPRTQRALIFLPFAFAANTVAFLSLYYVAHVKCAGEDDLDMLKLLALVRWIICTSGSRVLTASDSSGLSFLLLFLRM